MRVTANGALRWPAEVHWAGETLNRAELADRSPAGLWSVNLAGRSSVEFLLSINSGHIPWFIGRLSGIPILALLNSTKKPDRERK